MAYLFHQKVKIVRIARIVMMYEAASAPCSSAMPMGMDTLLFQLVS